MADEFSQESGSKTKLIQDMIPLLQKMASEFDRIDAKSKSITENLKGSASALGGAGGSAANSSIEQIAAGGGTFSGGFSNYMQSQGGALGFLKNVGSTVLGVASSAASALPTVQQAVSSQLLTSQAKFTGMQGNVNSTVQSLMGMGTTSSSTDVQQAIAQGAAEGVLPGLPGYNSQIMPGVMQLSNLTGSAQSAMQATASLNSAGSVNTLRMMGINVRGSNGAERNPASIFKDIYNFAVQQSGGKLNASNISIALQPGNGLANLLDAAAGGDSTLRQALQTAALQFAQGGNLSKSSTTQTGQTTAALNSQSALNQSQFGLLAASQNPEAQGFTEANNLLSKYTNELAGYVRQNQGIIKQIAKGETLLGSQLGQSVAGAITSALSGLGSLGVGKGLLKGGKSIWSKLFGGAETAVKDIGKVAKNDLLPIVEDGATLVAENPEILAALANGGPASAGGAYLVGERGPEIFVPNQSGTVVPNHLSASQINLLGNRGGGAGGLGQGAIVTPQTPAVGNGNAANVVLATGASLVGTPYAWGGGSINGPTTGTNQGSNTVGFDCSSFVQYAFARVGVMLPRTTYAQVNCGTAIDPSQAQPGDLLFFDGPATAPGHVAIYAGNGRLIQAPHTGSAIGYAYVDLRTVVAARRVLSGKTGTAINGNLLNGPHRSITSLAGNVSGLFSGLVGSIPTPPAGADMNSFTGYDPTSAMSGGVSMGSSTGGLGQGATGSSYNYGSTAMSRMYLSMNTRTGTLETYSGNGGTTINYGGVTITVPVPAGSQIDTKELASIIKAQVTALGINTKVANS